MNHVLKRTLTGLATGGLVIALFLYAPLKAFLPVLLVLSALVQLEFYQVAGKYRPVTWLGVLAGSLWLTLAGLFGFEQGLFVLAACGPLALVALTLVTSLYVLFRAKFENPVGTIASTLFGVLYVPFMIGFFLLVAQTCGEGLWGSDEWPRTGVYTLFAMIATAKLSDTGGFAFGLAFGRHKMCPSISPKKSWEGLVGSMLFSAATLCVFLAIARACDWGGDIRLWNCLSYPTAACAGAAIALLATAGDLVESRIKRECGVKDSATFMPAGMGGFLDMFDSVLFVPAVLYAVVLLSTI